jgi:hypothetical protein
MIDYFFEATTQDADKEIIAFGLDGRMHDLILCVYTPLHESKNLNLTFARYSPRLQLPYGFSTLAPAKSANYLESLSQLSELISIPLALGVALRN